MKTFLLMTMSALFLFSSCAKEKSPPKEPEENISYINLASGSSWVYQEINSSVATPIQGDYTVTSTSRDTTVNNKSYHIYNLSSGASRYLNLSGKDYYEFDTVPGTGAGIKTFERLYLKADAAIGTSWSQSEKLLVQGVEVPIKLTNTIIENSSTKVVQGKSYDKVVHVKTTLTSDLIPAASLITDINSYYAPDYGLIENTSKLNLNYLGIVEKIDISTTLKSANLK